MEEARKEDIAALKKYMEEEDELTYNTLKKAENDVIGSMENYREIIRNYDIDASVSADTIRKYDHLMEELDEVKTEDFCFYDLKRVTVYLELMVEELKKLSKTLQTRHRRLNVGTATNNNADKNDK